MLTPAQAARDREINDLLQRVHRHACLAKKPQLRAVLRDVMEYLKCQREDNLTADRD